MMEDASRNYLKYIIDELNPSQLRSVLAFVVGVRAIGKSCSSTLHREGQKGK